LDEDVENDAADLLVASAWQGAAGFDGAMVSWAVVLVCFTHREEETRGKKRWRREVRKEVRLGFPRVSRWGFKERKREQVSQGEGEGPQSSHAMCGGGT
jgi:hypothetical protein